MRATTRPLLLIACLAFVLPAGALDPLGDDAGSGADAGDHRLLAVPITPGSYEGRLTVGVDAHDHYTFDATAGELLKLAYHPGDDQRVRVWLYAPDGSVFDPAEDFTYYGSLQRLIDQNGTWGLHFELKTEGPVVPYTFTLELQSGHAFFGTIDASGATAEARFDTQGEVFASIRGTGVPPSLTDPWALANFIDYSLGNDDWQRRGSGSFTGVTGSPSDAPVTQWVGAGDEVPDLVSQIRGDRWVQSTLRGENVTGYFRLTSLLVDIPGHVDYAFWSTEPFEADAGAVHDPVVWASEEDPKEVDTPVLAVSPERSLDIDINGPFIGAFRPGVENASADGPHRTYNFTSAIGLTFYWADEGAWTLHIPETTRSAHHTEQLQFFGAHVPDLGVAPDPLLRYPDHHFAP